MSGEQSSPLQDFGLTWLGNYFFEPPTKDKVTCEESVQDFKIKGDEGEVSEPETCDEEKEDDNKYVGIETKESVSDTELEVLLKLAAVHHYSAVYELNQVDQNIHYKCSTLMKKNYECMEFENSGGAISWNYPYHMLIPISQRLNGDTVEGSEVINFKENFKRYTDYAEKAAIARCRARCPVPVILFKNKFICRSGTLANRKGAVYEQMMKSVKARSRTGKKELDVFWRVHSGVTVFLKNVASAAQICWEGVERLKKTDSDLLKVLRVKNICDLMVENRKIRVNVKVCSSEKINMAIYGDFNILRIPFPGCEFFSKYSKIKYSEDSNEKEQLKCQWETPLENESKLGSEQLRELPVKDVNWYKYKEWNLSTLTRNYIKLLLQLINTGNDDGFLIHCISGWDRTPLFISLIRISLWADGLIHEDLDVKQMAFLTLGYDWYLFGNTPANKEILLKRRSKIEDLSKLVLLLYKNVVEPISAALKEDVKNFKDCKTSELSNAYEKAGSSLSLYDFVEIAVALREEEEAFEIIEPQEEEEYEIIDVPKEEPDQI